MPRTIFSFFVILAMSVAVEKTYLNLAFGAIFEGNNYHIGTKR